MTPKSKMNGTEIGVRIGAPILNAGTVLGVRYVKAMPKVAAWPQRKWIGPAQVVLAGLAKVFVNDETVAQKLMHGVVDGLLVEGLIDVGATFIFDAKKADFGLSGVEDLAGEEEGGESWADVARKIAEADAMERRAAAKEANTETVTESTDIPGTSLAYANGGGGGFWEDEY